jgi:hypothetical protein
VKSHGKRDGEDQIDIVLQAECEQGFIFRQTTYKMVLVEEKEDSEIKKEYLLMALNISTTTRTESDMVVAF